MTNIKIQNIVDGGIPERERLVLKTVGPDNAGLYIVFLTSETSPGYVSSNPTKVYWFPDQELSMGDTIVLYTNQGTPSQKTNTDGTKIYFYHWGLQNTIWNDSADSAALLKIEQWNYKTKGSS
jgi:hypothetical protein